MKIEIPETVQNEPLRNCGGGTTSPYADPPLAPVFVVHAGDMDTSRAPFRLTWPEDEARTLHAELTAWIAKIDARKAAR